MVPLPDEILTEILSRLSVKSLLRFECVSKRWLSLITTPKFIQLHLKQAIQHSPRILYATYDDTYSIAYTTQSYVPKAYDYPVNDQRVIGSCNGLVCCSDKYYYMSLWNPATKEDVRIPYAEISDDLIEDEHEVVVGFSFVGDQYKVVRSVFFYKDEEHTEFQQCEVKVYTVGSKDWRTVDDPPCCLRYRHMVPQVNGALHWLSGPPMDSAKTVNSRIVAFDAGSEAFGIVPWIESIRSDDDNLDVTLSVLRGCLSTLCWHQGDSRIYVWSMKDYGVKESWTNLFSIRFPVLGIQFGSIEPLVLRDNGEFILKSSRELYVYDTFEEAVTTHTLCEYDEPNLCYKADLVVESFVSIASLLDEEAI